MELLGYTPKELNGKSGYDLFHPDDMVALMDFHKDCKYNLQGIISLVDLGWVHSLRPVSYLVCSYKWLTVR